MFVRYVFRVCKLLFRGWGRMTSAEFGSRKQKGSRTREKCRACRPKMVLLVRYAAFECHRKREIIDILILVLCYGLVRPATERNTFVHVLCAFVLMHRILFHRLRPFSETNRKSIGEPTAARSSGFKLHHQHSRECIWRSEPKVESRARTQPRADAHSRPPEIA